MTDKVSAERMERARAWHKANSICDEPDCGICKKEFEMCATFAAEEVRLRDEQLAGKLCAECSVKDGCAYKPAIRLPNGDWIHEWRGAKPSSTRCDAAAIWELSRDGRE